MKTASPKPQSCMPLTCCIRSDGTATVTFSDEYSATEAVKMLHQYPLDGRPMDVHFDRCVPAEIVGKFGLNW